MNRDTRVEIVRHAVRWAGNMLAEVMHNHAKEADITSARDIRSAIRNLNNAAAALDDKARRDDNDTA